MLDQNLINALRSYTKNMKNDVTLVVQSGEHPKKEELLNFLTTFATASNNLQVSHRDTKGVLNDPLSFYLEVDGKPNGILFSGIPAGHEFNSLVLAVLHSSGTEIKLDNHIKTSIGAIQAPLHFEVFISLSCHNCPDVVQALNQFAVLNPNITTQMIDGGLYPDMIKERDIQGVPSVYLNGEVFANGKVDIAELVQKLLALYPPEGVTQTEGELQDVTVIGGGPAGIGAAIYSARKGLNVTLIADRIGGQVKDTMGIENLISVPKTTGPELTGAMQKHMQDYDITLKEFLTVDSIEQGDIKRIILSSGETIRTRSIIIATGAKWRELGIPGEKENKGNGVAYCPHCDGPFFKGKDVAVIGGGNSGIEAAIDLAGIVNSVTVFEFADTFKADKVLVEQAKKRKNITLLNNVATQEITAKNGKVNGITYQDRATQTVHTQALEGVFVQIGLVPNSAFLNGLVEVSAFGEVIIDEKCTTSQSGIFACGDVTTVPYKQIVIAMGEGAKASLSAFDYLIKHPVQEENASATEVSNEQPVLTE